MCRVTRVKNSCGHTNDHVEMVCRHAKPVSPMEPGGVLNDTTNRHNASSNPQYPDPMKLARPISPGRAAQYVHTPPLPVHLLPYWPISLIVFLQ
jgi:hypothetical protein